MNRMSLIVVINLSVLLLMVVVSLAIRVAPVFTWSIIGLCTVVLLFILTENWMTHAAGEFENRFWTLVAFLAARAIFFSEDSPLQIARDRPAVAWFCVVVMTFLAHNYERNLRRSRLDQRPAIPRIHSADFASESKAHAQRKVLELRKLLAMIDSFWFSSAFMNLFFLPKVLHVEHQIIAIFAEATADELNLIISHVEFARILYKVKDHKIARRFNRSKLLNLLYAERISEFYLSSKVLLLDSLQRMKLSAHDKGQTYVRNIIKSAKADELSELKTITDSKGDINSMHKLIYQDIRNMEVRESILKYIAQQANVQAAYNLMKSRKSKERGKYAWRKILSDVDDTITCSGGSWPAGMDTSYPKKAVYPGVLSFYRELDLGVTGSTCWEPERTGNLVFLSARPHVYSDVSENVSYAKFKNLRETRGLHTSPALLAGSLDTGGKFMVRNDIDALAGKKYENFREYLTIYPEFTCVFIGDNGQGDVRTAEMILEDARFCDHLQRVYIHVVQPIANTCRRYDEKPVAADAGTNPEETAKAESKRQRIVSRIFYFHTYVDAAIDAFNNGFIRVEGLQRIMSEAVVDFNMIDKKEWIKAAITSKGGAPASASSGNGNRSRANSVSIIGPAISKTSVANTMVSLVSPSKQQTGRSDTDAAAPIISTTAVATASISAPVRASLSAATVVPGTPASVITTERTIYSAVDGTVEHFPSNGDAAAAQKNSNNYISSQWEVLESIDCGKGSGHTPDDIHSQSQSRPHSSSVTVGADRFHQRAVIETIGEDTAMNFKATSVPKNILRSTITSTIIRNLPPTPTMPSFTKQHQQQTSTPMSGKFAVEAGSELVSEARTNAAAAMYGSRVGFLPKGAYGIVKAVDAAKRAELVATQLREKRLRALNKDVEHGNEILKSAGLGTVSFPSYEGHMNIGYSVRTIFGVGIVTAYRPADGIYEINVSCVGANLPATQLNLAHNSKPQTAAAASVASERSQQLSCTQQSQFDASKLTEDCAVSDGDKLPTDRIPVKVPSKSSESQLPTSKYSKVEYKLYMTALSIAVT